MNSQRNRKQSMFHIATLLSSIAMLALSANPALATVTINGAGSTFTAPFVTATAATFDGLHSGYQINYQSVGSGQGITHLINKDIDFAASDAPLTDVQRASAPNSLHIPETIGSVTLSYTVPNATNMVKNLPKGLNLTAGIIAEIYLGNITMWNDAAIIALNPAWSSFLPAHSITTVHRCEGSGTTFIWTSFLSLASSVWANGIGKGTTVAWSKGAPGSVCGLGNSGVAAQVQGNSYFTGYVELNYAITQNLQYAKVKNPLGQFVEPTLLSTQAAVSASAGSLPTGDQSWYQVSLLNESATGAYPIASFTYFLIYKELNVISGETAEGANLVVSYLWYHIHSGPGGQDLAPALAYIPLPPNVVTINENTLNSVTFNGSPVSHDLSSQSQAPPGLPYALPIALLMLLLGAGGVAILLRRRSIANQN